MDYAMCTDQQLSLVSVVEELGHLEEVQLVFRTLRFTLHRSGCCVANPAHNAQVGCLLGSAGPEENALHLHKERPTDYIIGLSNVEMACKIQHI